MKTRDGLGIRDQHRDIAALADDDAVGCQPRAFLDADAATAPGQRVAAGVADDDVLDDGLAGVDHHEADVAVVFHEYPRRFEPTRRLGADAAAPGPVVGSEPVADHAVRQGNDRAFVLRYDAQDRVARDDDPRPFDPPPERGPDPVGHEVAWSSEGRLLDDDVSKRDLRARVRGEDGHAGDPLDSQPLEAEAPRLDDDAVLGRTGDREVRDRRRFAGAVHEDHPAQRRVEAGQDRLGGACAVDPHTGLEIDHPFVASFAQRHDRVARKGCPAHVGEARERRSRRAVATRCGRRAHVERRAVGGQVLGEVPGRTRHADRPAAGLTGKVRLAGAAAVRTGGGVGVALGGHLLRVQTMAVGAGRERREGHPRLEPRDPWRRGARPAVGGTVRSGVRRAHLPVASEGRDDDESQDRLRVPHRAPQSRSPFRFFRYRTRIAVPWKPKRLRIWFAT